MHFRSPEAGRYIPTVVVMSYDLKKVIAIVPFARGEAYMKLVSEQRKRFYHMGNEIGIVESTMICE